MKVLVIAGSSSSVSLMDATREVFAKGCAASASTAA